MESSAGDKIEWGKPYKVEQYYHNGGSNNGVKVLAGKTVWPDNLFELEPEAVEVRIEDIPFTERFKAMPRMVILKRVHE